MNHNDEKDYFELFALKILKTYQNLGIDKLIHDERPDWQDIDNSIGIEITRNSLGTQFWKELEKVKEPIPDVRVEKFNKRFIKNGGRIVSCENARILFKDKDGFGFNDKYFYILPVYNDDFSEVNKSLKDKLNKLNTIYKKMDDNRLFIFSPIYVTDEMIDNELQKIIDIQKVNERKFNIIYVCILHKLIVFDLNENEWKCIEMDREEFDKLSLESSNEIKCKN